MKLCVSCHRSFESPRWLCPHCGQSPRTLSSFAAFAPELANENENFPADGFHRLISLEEGNYWFRSRSKLILWALRKYFPSASTLFEIGCGNGYVLSCVAQAFPSLELSGSELYLQGLAYASKRMEKVQLMQMDARHLPFESEFDVIGAFDALEHIQEDEKVLAEIHRSLKPGGGLLLTVPQHAFLWSYADQFAGHARRYSSEELRRKVRNAGFEVVAAPSFVSLLFPLMLLSRKRQGNNPAGYDPTAELRLNPILNYLLEKILGFERWLIRLGLRLPFGGSLLLIARKV
jgi:SAM-dependent methyltransferase